MSRGESKYIWASRVFKENPDMDPEFMEKLFLRRGFSKDEARNLPRSESRRRKMQEHLDRALKARKETMAKTPRHPKAKQPQTNLILRRDLVLTACGLILLSEFVWIVFKSGGSSWIWEAFKQYWGIPGLTISLLCGILIGYRAYRAAPERRRTLEL
jgi:hypothetical protein